MSRGTLAQINLNALQHNFAVVRKHAADHHIWAMIKANAYGHGLIRVAKTLSDADAFGVATLDEALQLRNAGITQQIVVMSGFLSRDEINIFAEHQLAAVVHDAWQVAALEHVQLSTPLHIWLKVDTGMHRLGIQPEEFNAIYTALTNSANVQQPLAVMTHLADADNVQRDFTLQQIELYSQLTQGISAHHSLGNSAAIFAYTDFLTDWVRPGIMLYGASPFAHISAEELNLQPVMTLKSKVIAVKQIKHGEYIGYGCTWQCPEDMPIAVIAIGYGDGYPRHAPSGTPVRINEQIYPLVGRVSMDMITVDLRSNPNVKVGDEVILWGDGLPVEHVAMAAGTISYELLTQITRRVPFFE